MLDDEPTAVKAGGQVTVDTEVELGEKSGTPPAYTIRAVVDTEG